MVEFSGSWLERDLKIYRFGYGTVSVVAIHEFADGTEVSMLMLEEGLGAGEVGADVPSRVPGQAVYPEPGATLLVFENTASLDVVMDKLREIRDVLAQRESAHTGRLASGVITAHKISSSGGSGGKITVDGDTWNGK